MLSLQWTCKILKKLNRFFWIVWGLLTLNFKVLELKLDPEPPSNFGSSSGQFWPDPNRSGSRSATLESILNFECSTTHQRSEKWFRSKNIYRISYWGERTNWVDIEIEIYIRYTERIYFYFIYLWSRGFILCSVKTQWNENCLNHTWYRYLNKIPSLRRCGGIKEVWWN